MECVVCDCNQLSKYKCPLCFQPYCSVTCYKMHRTSPCEPPLPPAASSPPLSPGPRPTYEYPTADTVPGDKLKLLEHSSELRKCLENPHLRRILETLDRCEQPDALIKKYMQEPIFTEFVDECLKVVTDPDES